MRKRFEKNWKIGGRRPLLLLLLVLKKMIEELVAALKYIRPVGRSAPSLAPHPPRAPRCFLVWEVVL